MSVSIIMATWNGERFLREQLDSILNNSYQDWQLLIFDDGSRDRTAQIAEEYERRDPGRIHFYRNPRNLGVTANFLNGAGKAEGDYVMFCDQDDVWLPEKISHTLKKMERMEREWGTGTPLAVFADARVVDEALKELAPSFHRAGRLNTKKVDLAHLLMENKLIGCTMLFNRALLDKLRLLPKRARMHDWWVGLAAAAFGRIGYLDEAVLLYRQHSRNVVGNQGFASYVKSRTADRKARKQALLETFEQAREFYEIYGGELPGEQKRLVSEFTKLRQSSWFSRRCKALRFGFTKSGLIRNIGLMLAL